MLGLCCVAASVFFNISVFLNYFVVGDSNVCVPLIFVSYLLFFSPYDLVQRMTNVFSNHCKISLICEVYIFLLLLQRIINICFRPGPFGTKEKMEEFHVIEIRYENSL
jgi:hypothetical protein